MRTTLLSLVALNCSWAAIADDTLSQPDSLLDQLRWPWSVSTDYSDDLLNLSLDQLLQVEMVSASKYAQPLSEIPSAITVITADQIRGFGYRSLGEALRSIAGMQVSNNRIDDALVVRGLAGNTPNTNVLFMIDDFRLREPITDGGTISTAFPLDIDLIDRVEIVRGPASSVYGGNAVLATVNVITKKGRAYQGGEASGSYGSFDTFKGRFSYGRKQGNGLEYLLSGSSLNSDGPNLYYPEYDSLDTNSGWTRSNYEHNKNFFAKASYGDFTFIGGWLRRAKGVPAGIRQSDELYYRTNFNDANNRAETTQGFMQLQYQAQVTPQLQLTGRAWHGDQADQSTGSYDYNGAIGDFKRFDLSQSSWSGLEVRFLSTHLDNHHILGGVEIQENWQQREKEYAIWSVDPSATPDVGQLFDRDTHRIGVYLQDDYHLSKTLNLSVGARFDDYSNVTRAQVSPRVGLTWQAQPSTLLKFQYGKSFRPPNVDEQFYAIDLFPGYWNRVSPSKGLRPESTQTLQAGWEQTFQHWKFNTNLYYIWQDDLIVDGIPDPLEFQYKNIGHAASWGGEFELERKWRNGVLLRSSYSLNYAQNRSGDALWNAPRHLFKLNLLTPLWSEHWQSGLELQGVSPRQGALRSVPGYVLTNLTVNWQPINSINLSAGVYNLFDRDFLDPLASNGGVGGAQLYEIISHGVPPDGRTFRLKLDYRF